MRRIMKILGVITIVALLLGGGVAVPVAATPEVTVSIDAPAQAAPDPGWYDASWAYRKQITVDYDRVGIASDLSSDASSGQCFVVRRPL